MATYFCDEPIIAVYIGHKYDIDGSNAHFNCCNELAYHITEGYRIILETKTFFISLGHNGVIKSVKSCSVEDLAQDGESIDTFIHCFDDNEPPCINYESTLFVGERLLDVQPMDGFYPLTFDDFKLKIVPHELNNNNFPSLKRKNDWCYNRVLGADRLIKGKCQCGGDGELLLDFVYDYVVRCKRCKKSTRAEMFAVYAIKEWNEGHIQCDLSDIIIE